MDNEPTTPAGTCPRCGDPLPARQTGRPPVWCSQRCRRAAYEERRAAANGAIALQVVRTPPVEKEHDLSECVRRASDSPAGCRRILLALTALARDGKLRSDPKWESTLTALGTLNDVLYRASETRSPWFR